MEEFGSFCFDPLGSDWFDVLVCCRSTASVEYDVKGWHVSERLILLGKGSH